MFTSAKDGVDASRECLNPNQMQRSGFNVGRWKIGDSLSDAEVGGSVSSYTHIGDLIKVGDMVKRTQTVL